MTTRSEMYIQPDEPQVSGTPLSKAQKLLVIVCSSGEKPLKIKVIMADIFPAYGLKKANLLRKDAKGNMKNSLFSITDESFAHQ